MKAGVWNGHARHHRRSRSHHHCPRLVPCRDLAGGGSRCWLSWNVVRSLVAQPTDEQATAMVVTVVRWALNPAHLRGIEYETRPISNSWNGRPGKRCPG